MNNTIILEDSPNYVRDINSKAILNKNKSAYEELLSKRGVNAKIRELESKMTGIESSLNNITRLLQRLTDDSK